MQEVQGQARTLRLALESRLGLNSLRRETIGRGWSGMRPCYSTFIVEETTEGPLGSEERGRAFRRDMPEFGVKVQYLKPGSVGTHKFESRWQGDAIFLGLREESGEWIVGTKEGVIKCRTLREVELESDRWDKQLIASLKGTPWEPIPGREDIEITTRPTPVGEAIPRFEEPADADDTVKRMRIYRRDVMKYTATPECKGCTAAIRGARSQHHAEQCRVRLEKLIEENENDRYCREMERINKQLAERLAREVKEEEEEEEEERPKAEEERSREGEEREKRERPRDMEESMEGAPRRTLESRG